jgi:hypothetical protein
MKLHADRAISLTAMVIGLGSLFIIVYQTALIRQSQHASALPYLMISVSADSAGVFVTLRNSGVGPALIDNIRVLYQGRDYPGDPFAFYEAIDRGSDDTNLYTDRVLSGMLVPAGETVRMLGGTGERRAAMLGDLLKLFDFPMIPKSWRTQAGVPSPSDVGTSAVIEVTYSSIYGDHWRSRSDGATPERL